MRIRLSSGKEIPIEMHKVRVVQKTSLPPVGRRLRAIEEAGYNTFMLRSRDIFIDMLTDSGTNAMSDNQLASMMVSDDAYAGGESFYKLADAVKDVLGYEYCLPAHQGRAAEHLLAKVFVKPGQVVVTNYHFTTTKAHFELAGGGVLELYTDEALKTTSSVPFKGNLDIEKFKKAINERGAENISFVRMEATTNLIGGQPFSMENLRAVKKVAAQHNIPLVIDGSLISENAYFINQREPAYKNVSVAEIVREMMNLADILYMSGRKSACVRGGLIATNRKDIYDAIKPWLPVYEGFLTYGGMSSKELEAMAVGIREMVDFDVAGSSADMIKFFVELLDSKGVPVVTPPGGLAGHVDAMRFLPHIAQTEYPAGALAAAIYIVSGVRCMERGTVSMDRDHEGNDVPSDLELARFAVPRRVYTQSHMEYVADRLAWLHENKDLVGGLKFYEEPPVLRFFMGKMNPLDNWGVRLSEKFIADFGAEV